MSLENPYEYYSYQHNTPTTGKIVLKSVKYQSTESKESYTKENLQFSKKNRVRCTNYPKKQDPTQHMGVM